LPLATRNVRIIRTSSNIMGSCWSPAKSKETDATMRLRIPEGNVRVPLPVFEEVWTRAERLLRDDRSSRYLAGVCAAWRWVAGHPEALSPLCGRRVRATAELILCEDVLATMTYTRSPGGDPDIDPDWAAVGFQNSALVVWAALLCGWLVLVE
jgi:hypothetical protein